MGENDARKPADILVKSKDPTLNQYIPFGVFFKRVWRTTHHLLPVSVIPPHVVITFLLDLSSLAMALSKCWDVLASISTHTGGIPRNRNIHARAVILKRGKNHAIIMCE